MNAYDSQYLYDAMEIMGEAFDCAEAGIGMQAFMDAFVASGIADAFGVGSPKYVAGVSGVELVGLVCDATGLHVEPSRPTGALLDRSPAYWCGWILAYYQWESGRPFRNIARRLSMAELERLYNPWHEASERRAADVIDELVRRPGRDTRLKELRRLRGWSQAQLAARSGVSLRSIQQYEQRQKSVDRAQASALRNLARALGTTMEDLLEYDG